MAAKAVSVEMFNDDATFATAPLKVYSHCAAMAFAFWAAFLSIFTTGRAAGARFAPTALPNKLAEGLLAEKLADDEPSLSLLLLLTLCSGRIGEGSSRR